VGLGDHARVNRPPTLWWSGGQVHLTMRGQRDV